MALAARPPRPPLRLSSTAQLLLPQPRRRRLRRMWSMQSI